MEPGLDVWRPNSEWNVSAKIRGIYKDRSVKEMSNDDLENLEVTKTLLSRLLGQTHEPTEKTYSPLLICLKFLGRRASKLTSKWNEPIPDDELHTELVKILNHIRDTPILPQDRAVIPKNFRPTSAAFFVSTFQQSNLGMNHLLQRFWNKLRDKLT